MVPLAAPPLLRRLLLWRRLRLLLLWRRRHLLRLRRLRALRLRQLRCRHALRLRREALRHWRQTVRRRRPSVKLAAAQEDDVVARWEPSGPAIERDRERGENERINHGLACSDVIVPRPRDKRGHDRAQQASAQGQTLLTWQTYVRSADTP